MNRRDVLQATVLGAFGAAVSFFPAEAEGHSHNYRIFPPEDVPQQVEQWSPLFLDEHQNQTLIVLSDLMIPETETPGAKKALVNRFIDALLAAEIPEAKRSFLDSMAYLDSLSIRQHRSGFVHLSKEQQLELLNLIAYPHTLRTWGEQARESESFAHFSRLKGWISRAYYSSEIGMKELGWDGGFIHGEPQACLHPSGTHPS